MRSYSIASRRRIIRNFIAAQIEAMGFYFTLDAAGAGVAEEW